MKSFTNRIVAIPLAAFASVACFSGCITYEEEMVGLNYCQQMIVDEWSIEVIEQYMPSVADSLDTPTGGNPRALALAAMYDRWEVADIFLDYGADYELACNDLRKTGKNELADKLEHYSIERRKNHPVIEAEVGQNPADDGEQPIESPASGESNE